MKSFSRKNLRLAALAALSMGTGILAVQPPTTAPVPLDLQSAADFDPFHPEEFLIVAPQAMTSKSAKPAMSRNVVSLPTISVSGPGTVVQSGTASTTATFTVTLSSTSKSAVTVKYTTANGTAESGDDYTAKSGTLVFAPGQKTMTVTVKVLPETNSKEIGQLETFYLKLSSATGATIKTPTTSAGVKLAAPAAPRTPVRPPHPTFG